MLPLAWPGRLREGRAIFWADLALILGCQFLLLSLEIGGCNFAGCSSLLGQF